MALIKCPECSKEVSDSTYKCPNCGFVIKAPKRSITGEIFKFLFMGFNAIMLLMLIIMMFTASSFISDPELQKGGAGAIAAGAGIGTLIFLWILGALPLGVLSYITRPKAND